MEVPPMNSHMRTASSAGCATRDLTSAMKPRPALSTHTPDASREVALCVAKVNHNENFELCCLLNWES